jgi:hypothetical protein
VCLGDAVDDCQAETNTGLDAADAFGAPLERFGECRNQLWLSLSPVFSAVSRTDSGPMAVLIHGAVFGEVVDDGVVQKVRSHLQQESV